MKLDFNELINLKIIKWLPFIAILLFLLIAPQFLPYPWVAFSSGVVGIIFTRPGLIGAISELSISKEGLTFKKNVIDGVRKIHRAIARNALKNIAGVNSRSGSSEDKFRLQVIEENLESENEIAEALREIGVSEEEILRERRIIHAYNAFDLFDLAWGKITSKSDDFNREIREKRQEIGRDIMYGKKYSEAIVKLRDLVIRIKTISLEESLNDFNSAIVHFEKYLKDHKEEL